MPGFGSKSAATFCEDASCTSNQPFLKASVINTFARSLKTSACGYPFIVFVCISSSFRASCTCSSVAFIGFTLRTTSACLFKAVNSLSHFFPNSFTPSSSNQSGIDSLIFLVFDNSSKRPLIRLVGVCSNCVQSLGIAIPFRVHQTANILYRLPREKGACTSAISS